MNSLTRFATVLGLAVGVVVGSSIPAGATFSDTAAVPSTTYGTATVAAPGNVVGALACGGKSDSTMSVTWTQSNAARISGYRIKVHFSDGFVSTRDVAATATSWSSTITTFNVTQYSIRYSVTTLTDYGWSTESALTGSFRC
jgi:hypothetical protein